MGRTPLLPRLTAFLIPGGMSVRGISTPFGALFPTKGQVRTCSSAVRRWGPEGPPHDLHALGTPPALILSQDQTRHQTVKRTGDHASQTASPPCGGERDARCTRQLVRCGRQKSERAVKGLPTRLNGHRVMVCPQARPCRCRQRLVYQVHLQKSSTPGSFLTIPFLCLRSSAKQPVTTISTIPRASSFVKHSWHIRLFPCRELSPTAAANNVRSPARSTIPANSRLSSKRSAYSSIFAVNS
jgi:hypothetical protein